jgi:hypothetical protein
MEGLMKKVKRGRESSSFIFFPRSPARVDFRGGYDVLPPQQSKEISALSGIGASAPMGVVDIDYGWFAYLGRCILPRI